MLILQLSATSFMLVVMSSLPSVSGVKYAVRVMLWSMVNVYSASVETMMLPSFQQMNVLLPFAVAVAVRVVPGAYSALVSERVMVPRPVAFTAAVTVR